MNLEKVRNTAIRLMREHGLTDYTFKWDKAVRRFGSCNGRTKVITLFKTNDSIRKLMKEEL